MQDDAELAVPEERAVKRQAALREKFPKRYALAELSMLVQAMEPQLPPDVAKALGVEATVRFSRGLPFSTAALEGLITTVGHAIS